jgi:hypothetical protein
MRLAPQVSIVAPSSAPRRDVRFGGLRARDEVPPARSARDDPRYSVSRPRTTRGPPALPAAPLPGNEDLAPDAYAGAQGDVDRWIAAARTRPRADGHGDPVRGDGRQRRARACRRARPPAHEFCRSRRLRDRRACNTYRSSERGRATPAIRRTDGQEARAGSEAGTDKRAGLDSARVGGRAARHNAARALSPAARRLQHSRTGCPLAVSFACRTSQNSMLGNRSTARSGRTRAAALDRSGV